jgi:hypothetical protein
LKVSLHVMTRKHTYFLVSNLLGEIVVYTVENLVSLMPLLQLCRLWTVGRTITKLIGKLYPVGFVYLDKSCKLSYIQTFYMQFVSLPCPHPQLLQWILSILPNNDGYRTLWPKRIVKHCGFVLKIDYLFQLN